jgi:hypothetical protein
MGPRPNVFVNQADTSPKRKNRKINREARMLAFNQSRKKRYARPRMTAPRRTDTISARVTSEKYTSVSLIRNKCKMG